MKLLAILFISLSFGLGTAISQSCLPSGIVFTKQAQIDSFQSNYPGCQSIEGHVGVIGDIVDLHGLDILTEIQGNFTLAATNLHSLSGLENLKTIKGDLSIGQSFLGGNPALESLTGLQGLKKISGNFMLRYNAVLRDLSGLQNVTSIRGDIYIYCNAGLVSLSGLDQVTWAEGNAQGEVHIIENPNLSFCATPCICTFISAYLTEHPELILIRDNAAGCMDWLQVRNACLVSTGSPQQGRCLPIYPNPARDMIHIDGWPDQEIQRIVVYDLTGKPVLTKNHDVREVDVSGLPAGMYIVSMAGGAIVTNQKVLIRR